MRKFVGIVLALAITIGAALAIWNKQHHEIAAPA
jgi:uncharacterized protein YxeA